MWDYGFIGGNHCKPEHFVTKANVWIWELLLANQLQVTLKKRPGGRRRRAPHDALSNHNSRIVRKRTEPTWMNRRLYALIISPDRKSWDGWIGCDWGWVTSTAPCADCSICGVHRRGTDRLHIPSMLSSKPPDSVEKNSDLSSQNTGVSGAPLPHSPLGLFVLTVCDFGVLTY